MMNLSKNLKIGDKVYCIKYYKYDGNSYYPTVYNGKTYIIDAVFPNVYGINGILFNKEHVDGYRNFDKYFTNIQDYRLRKLRVLKNKS